jgi:Txe/YoeB family toxin of toxin-antitoxin system
LKIVPQILSRLSDLIKECQRTPFIGTGKPEPLRGDLKGWSSRRVTLEDRLVCRVSGSGSAHSWRLRSVGGTFKNSLESQLARKQNSKLRNWENLV